MNTPKKFDLMMLFFIIGNFYVAWYAKGIGRNPYGRIEGVGPSDAMDGNGTAAIFISAIPLIMYYIGKFKGMKRIFLILILAYVMNGVIFINICIL